MTLSPDIYEHDEPASYREAMASPNVEQWLEAVHSELSGLNSMDTFEFVPRSKLPPGAKPITSKWVFKRKGDPRSPLFKARLVARGFLQRQGIDYFEVFAPTVSYDSVRVLFSIACANNLPLRQLDVTLAFVNAPMEEDVFMTSPDGFINVPVDEFGQPMVVRLNRSLYGLKQSNRNWRKFITVILLQFDVTHGLHRL